MSDHMDSGIKLFGRVIPLLHEAAQPGSPEAEGPAGSEQPLPLPPPPELETPAPVEVEPEDRKVSCCFTRGFCLIVTSIPRFPL